MIPIIKHRPWKQSLSMFWCNESEDTLRNSHQKSHLQKPVFFFQRWWPNSEWMHGSSQRSPQQFWLFHSQYLIIHLLAKELQQYYNILLNPLCRYFPDIKSCLLFLSNCQWLSQIQSRHLAISEDTCPIRRNFLAFRSQSSWANVLTF